MLFKKLIPAIFWALIILGLCALPGAVIPDMSFLDWLKPDKIVHLFLFGVLSFLLIKAFAEQVTVEVLSAHLKLISFFLTSVYGVLIEILQEYCIPGRNGDVFDSLADALGAILGLWLYNYWSRRRHAKIHY
ncbi:MAG: VanZ family protein [Bacteroidota bacterium]